MNDPFDDLEAVGQGATQSETPLSDAAFLAGDSTIGQRVALIEDVKRIERENQRLRRDNGWSCTVSDENQKLRNERDQWKSCAQELAVALRQAVHQGDGHSTSCAKLNRTGSDCNCWNKEAVDALSAFDHLNQNA